MTETGTLIPLNDLSRGWIATAQDVRAAVERVLSSGWYLLGPETEAFERELAGLVGARHGIGLANGTDALRIALLATGCEPGAEVVTAANAGGYAAVAAASIGCDLVYADVDPRSLVVTADTVARAIGPRTRAVVVTHLYGNVADTRAIVAVCRPAGIAVVEDCAQSLGAVSNGRPVGGNGDIATFSFYPTKNLGAAGDGGAVVTDDDQVAAAARQLRQYGWGEKYRIERERGWNSRLDEIQAAILRLGLARIDEFNEQRRSIVRRYREALTHSSVRPVSGETADFVAHLAVIRSSQRSALAAHLRSAGIATAVHYPVPDHRQAGLPPPARPTDLAATELASAEVLSLPCFPEMTLGEIDRVTQALATAG